MIKEHGIKSLLILLELKVDQSSGNIFVDFVVVVHITYMIQALRVANNDLIRNLNGSPISFIGGILEGKRIHNCLKHVLVFRKALITNFQ